MRCLEEIDSYDFVSHKELVAMQPGDVPVTYADTSALERDFSTFGGGQVIQSGQLNEQDTKKLALPNGGSKGAGFPQGKFRGVLKEAILMTDPLRA